MLKFQTKLLCSANVSSLVSFPAFLSKYDKWNNVSNENVSNENVSNKNVSNNNVSKDNVSKENVSD